MAPFISVLYINKYKKSKATSVHSCGENHPLNGEFR